MLQMTPCVKTAQHVAGAGHTVTRVLQPLVLLNSGYGAVDV